MSARLERQRRRRQRGGASRVIIITISVLIAGVVIAGLSAVGYVVGIANSAPELNTLKPQDPGRLSRVFAADGKQLGIIQNDVLRIPIESSQMPQDVRNATVAIEDERFYRHKGVDFEGVIRAAFKNASSGKTLQGGSTLTMQLIRTLYTRQPREVLQAQGPRGQARRGARERPHGPQGQEVDPHEVPQLGALRHQRRPAGRRHPGRGARVLRQAAPRS